MPKLKSHPITKWLNKNCWSYHKHQIDTLEEATKGYDILLVAPTGGGKTLAGFMPAITDLIEKKYISKKNNGKYNFANFIKEYNLLLDNQLSQLLKIDKNLNPILSSLKKRHHNDFDNLNKKIIKSLKTMDETSINQIRKLYYKIFPNGVQQERYINFSHFYSIMGTELIDKLFSVIDPFEPKYKVCVL